MESCTNTSTISDTYHDNADTKYQELYLDFSQPVKMLNVTSVALNQTALNQTVIEGVNDTATTNETSTQTNFTFRGKV